MIFQTFKAYEAYLVWTFQRENENFRQKHNRSDKYITKEVLMSEALSTYDNLFLEKNWTTQDNKNIVFSDFSPKQKKALNKTNNNAKPSSSNNGRKKDKEEKKKQSKTFDPWKLILPNKNEVKIKKVDETYFTGAPKSTSNENQCEMSISPKTIEVSNKKYTINRYSPARPIR